MRDVFVQSRILIAATELSATAPLKLAAREFGFRAATMREIAQPKIDFGVTSGTYDCPFSASYDPLGYFAAGYICADGLQYEVYQVSNPELKPETSTQWNVGLIWQPTPSFSAGLNYWSVEIEDGVSSVSEQLILENAPTYLSLYTTKFKQPPTA